VRAYDRWDDRPPEAGAQVRILAGGTSHLPGKRDSLTSQNGVLRPVSMCPVMSGSLWPSPGVCAKYVPKF
jgi:hypothetical protein